MRPRQTMQCLQRARSSLQQTHNPTIKRRHSRSLIGALCVGLLLSCAVNAAPQHGYNIFNTLKYPADFRHFDYVNPAAPKGGTLKLIGIGDFDSLNPYILAGRSPANTPGLFVFGFLEMTDTLMMSNDGHNQVGDETGSAYGLIAKTIDCQAQLDFCTFTLRDGARFQDGQPIQSDDVVFSFQLLREQGHPRHMLQLQQIERAEALSPNQVRFYFSGEQRRHLPLIAGNLPVLPKHYWQKRDFSKPSLDIPVISGPYRIGEVKAGRRIVFQRDPDYWGRDLPINVGRYNFDQVSVDFFRDAQVAFESFKAGGYDVHLDYIAKHWATAYDFPAVRDGRVKKVEIPHRIAQGTQAFFINQRRAPLDDIRVRQALGLLFDFEWTNRAIFNGAYQRQTSWFPNTANASSGLPTGKELALLKRFSEQLPAALFEQPIAPPISDGSGRDRQHIQQALALLNQAGWKIQNGKLINVATGEPLTLEILNYHSPGMERVILPWLRNLAAAGIQASPRSVDQATFKERLDNFDFDLTVFVLPQKSFPGAELREYFHSDSVNMTGGRNYAGISHPVIDALVDKVLDADNLGDYRAALHALDRVLLWQHYTIPHWYLGRHRLAYWQHLQRPDTAMPYILGTETWWHRDAQSEPATSSATNASPVTP